MRIKTFPIPLLMLAIGLWDGSLSKSAAASPETNSPPPLTRAHAHNDYEHTRPLLDALDHGFCSIEADIWLVDGKLLVAHERGNVKPDRTLQALYLDPLRERVRWNGVMPEETRQRLGKIVTKAHAQGRKVRFWATPDKPEVWAALFDAGVDLINTDDLAGLQKFLLSPPRK